VSPQKFARWASGRRLPQKIIDQLTRLAASPEEMQTAIDNMEPAPPIYTLVDIVDMTDNDPYGISPSANGFVIVGGCPNGDPIAIDIASDPGSVWYISHETMSGSPLRDVAIWVAENPLALMKGMGSSEFPFDYYDARDRQRSHPRRNDGSGA
jgi:hypothetical protein